MTAVPNREIEYSHLSSTITRDGFTVKVYIYRFAGTDDPWMLEIINDQGASAVWNEIFDDDLGAYDAAERAVAEEGIWSFSADEGTAH